MAAAAAAAPAGPPAIAPAPLMPAIVTALAAICSTSVDMIHLLSDDLLKGAVAKAGLQDDFPARTALETWLLARRPVMKDTAQILAQQFERQDVRTYEEWRLFIDRHAKEREAVASTTPTELGRHFLHLAKGRHLSHDDVFAAGYAICGDAQAMRFYAHLLLNKAPAERVRAHNFFVAAHMPNAEGFYLNFGKLLHLMPVPLFPPTADFHVLNTSLMKEFSEWMARTPATGGGSSSDTAAAASFTTPLYAPVPVAEGGGALQVVSDGHGGHVVDVTVIEEAFSTIYQQVKVLTTEVEAQKSANAAGRATTAADNKALWERMQKAVTATKNALNGTQRRMLQLVPTKGTGGRGARSGFR